MLSSFLLKMSATSVPFVQTTFDAVVKLKALHSAPSKLYDDRRNTWSGLARLVNAKFKRVPGTSCGRIIRSYDFKDLVSLPYFALAVRMV